MMDRVTANLPAIRFDETIAFYAAASWVYRERTYQALTPEEFRRYTELGQQLARWAPAERGSHGHMAAVAR